MFIQPIVGWVKNLAKQFAKSQTYGAELESYILSHDPQTASDVDRLMREFAQKTSGGYCAS